MSALLQAALTYAESGRRVHPCRPEDKRPMTRWGSEATLEPRTIVHWWNRWPDALIAVCTGDGLVVVDIDPRNGGEQDTEACIETLTATTRSGGWHHYYRTGVDVRNVIGLTPGVDIRGGGGYVIAPPSPGWAWLNDAPLQPLPEPILAAINARKLERRHSSFEPAPNGSVGEGYRHDYMVRFAGWAIRGLELHSEAELVLECVEEYARACSPADAPTENIVKIARSIWRADQRA